MMRISEDRLLELVGAGTLFAALGGLAGLAVTYVLAAFFLE